MENRLTRDVFATVDGIPLPELETLCNAYRENRAVVMPVKIGNKVFWIDENEVIEVEVISINARISSTGNLYFEVYFCSPVKRVVCAKLGAIVFLTRAEAEAALAREGE